MDTNALFAVAMISATISLIGVIVSIFTANWLNQRSVEKLIEQLKKRFDAKFDSVGAKFDSIEAKMSSLQNEIRSEIKRINQRLDSIETRIGNIERQLDRVFQPVLPPK